MKPLKENVSITLDPEILEIITYMAEKEERSFSSYVNSILRYWIKIHSSKKGTFKEQR